LEKLGYKDPELRLDIIHIDITEGFEAITLTVDEIVLG